MPPNRSLDEDGVARDGAHTLLQGGAAKPLVKLAHRSRDLSVIRYASDTTTSRYETHAAPASVCL